MSSALKIARRYKDINSIGLHFERTHITVVVKAGCNLKTRMPARNDRENLSLIIGSIISFRYRNAVSVSLFITYVQPS